MNSLPFSLFVPQFETTLCHSRRAHWKAPLLTNRNGKISLPPVASPAGAGRYLTMRWRLEVLAFHAFPRC